MTLKDTTPATLLRNAITNRTESFLSELAAGNHVPNPPFPVTTTNNVVYNLIRAVEVEPAMDGDIDTRWQNFLYSDDGHLMTCATAESALFQALRWMWNERGGKSCQLVHQFSPNGALLLGLVADGDIEYYGEERDRDPELTLISLADPYMVIYPEVML